MSSFPFTVKNFTQKAISGKKAFSCDLKINSTSFIKYGKFVSITINISEEILLKHYQSISDKIEPDFGNFINCNIRTFDDKVFENVDVDVKDIEVIYSIWQL